MTKNIVIAVLVILVLLFGVSYFGGSRIFGANVTGLVHQQIESFARGLQIGDKGTVLTKLNSGLCYIRPYAATVAASSTASVDCQATKTWNVSGMSKLAGVTNNDYVAANLSTTTAGTTFIGLTLIGASASTTSGYLTLKVANFTGTTYTWSVTAGTASGTATYFIAK